MLDHARHVPAARYRSATGHIGNRKAPLLHRGAKTRGNFRDMYATDHAEPRREGRFRWLMSTCLAATVGAVAILVVIFGSADQQDAHDGLMPALQRLRDSTAAPPLEAMLRREDGLRWAVPKVDRMRVLTGAMSTRYIIHETLRQKRGGREYIYAKPYVRIVARLAPVPANYADVIPPFNPFKLYDNNKPIGGEEEGAPQSATTGSDVTVRVVELLGGILPGEDGQELDADEARDLVTKSELSDPAGPSQQPLGGADPAPLDALGDKPDAKTDADAHPANTTILAKGGGDTDDAPSDLDVLKPVVRTVKDGDKLTRILIDAGTETWQVREMLDAMKSVFPESALTPGQEIRIALQPSLTEQNRMEPARFSIYDPGHAHRVTVMRNNAGEFIASATPVDEEALSRQNQADNAQSQSSSLYASLYHAALLQSVQADTIQTILKTHAYETDFRRRLRAGDACEFFFDLKDDGSTEGPPGELLFTSVTAAGDTTRYYRFRTPDGQVDFFDAQGNNAKKFLNRKPVRSDDVRLTSGFGLRFHPLLNEKRMHTGVDWATTPGTPVLASGNGVIEEADRKGQYGNYIRIRHANGYQTAYGHMARFAPGAAPGVKVRQGQIIGYVGSTGLSSGPHLHFEVLVNNQFVDPLSIQMPRERQLSGRELIEFQKERARIDDLMRRAPVLTTTK